MTEKSRSNKLNLTIVVVIALLVAVGLLSAFQVRNNEVALVSTFGKFSEQTYGPGLHWKLPWPFQKVYRYDTSLQLFQGRYEENLTADEKTLVMTLFAAWQVTDPVAYANQNLSKERVNQLLSDLIRTEKGVVISSHPVSHLISADATVRNFSGIEKEIQDRVAAQLKDKGYGVRVVSLGIEQVGLPARVTQDVFSRMAAERRIKADNIQQTGLLEAGRIRAEGQRQRGEIEAAAKEAAKNIRSEGDLAAAEKYKVFEQDRDFAIFLKELESLERLMSKKTTLVIDREHAPFSLLKGEFLDQDKGTSSKGA